MRCLRCGLLIVVLLCDACAGYEERDPCPWFYSCAAKADYELPPSVHVPDDSDRTVERRHNNGLALVGGSPEIARPIDDRGNVFEFRNGIVKLWIKQPSAMQPAFGPR
jgi:hypothetical protein